MTQRVVIGSGPDGLRAAAAVAATGASVVFLQQGPGPSGLSRPDLPEGDGSIRLAGGIQRSALEAVVGPVREVAAPRLSIAMGGSVHSLPLRPDRVGSLLPGDARRIAARAWLRARGRNALAELVGGGQEERTLRDWVVRRMGVPAYDELYADYAERRWGAPAATLGVSVARRHHFLPDDASRVQIAGGAVAALDSLADRVRQSGTLRTDVVIEGFHVEEGRVRSVVLAGGEQVDTSGGLWVEDVPNRAVEWLGDAGSPGLRVDASRLPARDRARVGLEAVSIDEGEVVHLLSPSGPAWRVIGLGAGAAVADCTLDADGVVPPDLQSEVVRQVAAAGMGSPRPDGGGIEYERDAVPLWEITTPAVLREVLGPLRAVGVVLVGARGAVADLGPGEALALATRYAADGDPDQREAQRQLVQVPTRIDDLGARITRFVTR